ncbi:MAG: glycosyltransferase family 4 protein [Nitrospirae bacterium]|nr:glycosyltransferase family 4 protein [Nitrospirota bacterium]
MPEKFYPLENPEDKYAIKKRLGIEADKKIITFSGRLVQRKRVDLLLRAVSKIVKARRDIRVVILGHGELLEDLQGLAPELSIREYVSFKGFVSNILDYLHVADIFVLTSDMEGMPNSLLEAMACGLPVIATRIGGVVDIVEDKKNGLLVAAGDEEELKDAILKLLGDEQLSKSISQEAYKTIRENYYIDKVADKYISLYQRLAA